MATAKSKPPVNPIDKPGVRAKVREAIADCGVPLNARAVETLIDKIADAIE